MLKTLTYIFLFIKTLKCFDHLEECCDVLRISTIPASYEDFTGVFESVHGSHFNGKKVYRNTEDQLYLFYWIEADINTKNGEFWQIGHNFTRWFQTKSPNMAGRGNAWCPEDINKLQMPFDRKDGSSLRNLRIECYDRPESCCNIIHLFPNNNYHYQNIERFGVYISDGKLFNGRPLYKHAEVDSYIYYYDWGLNSGANWMISSQVGSTVRDIESANLEFNNSNTCLVQNRVQSRILSPDWRIFDFVSQEWSSNQNLDIECV